MQPCTPLTKSLASQPRFAGSIAALLTLSAWTSAFAAPGDTERISAGETPPTISANGRFVGFRWDGNADPRGYFFNWDIYVADRSTGGVQRISDASTDWEPEDDSYLGNNVALSADGRYVAWMSRSIGVGYVPHYEVLVRDRQTGATEHVTEFLGPGPDALGIPTSYKVSISADGRFVTFDSNVSTLVASDTNAALDVFVYDRLNKVFTRMSVASGGAQANGRSDNATISPNGRYVAFWSSATNLVPGDTNNLPDLFVRDRWTGLTERVSMGTGGQQASGSADPSRDRPAISNSGRYVAFVTLSNGLVDGDTDNDTDVFVRDRTAHVTQRIPSGPAGAVSGVGGGVSLNSDGRYVAFVSASSTLVPGDTNAAADVFVHDRATSTVEIASVRNNGLQLSRGEQPSLSADGQFVAFFSFDRALGRRNESIYVHELGGTDIWGYRLIGGSDFGTQKVGTVSTARSYTVVNTGAVTLPIARVELRGTNTADFVLDSRCGAWIPVGGRCNVRVSFAPKSTGIKTAKLAVVFTLREGTGVASKNLQGQGVL